MAGTEVGSLYYDLNIDDKNLKRQLDEADSSVKSFGERASAYWGDATAASKKLLLGVAAVGAGLVAFGVSSVKAYNESQMALTQLDAVLKSTGSAAGVTREAAIALSREIQRTTSVSDETALAVENMGLTFTAIHKDIFPQTTKAAIDMATALNHGIAPSAEQATDTMKLLGKALQDPDAGLGALHRVGVNVNDLQKQFVGVNDVATKQRLILTELGKEFGGSATAQSKTFAGELAQLKNNFNDLQEQVGQTILRALQPLIAAFGKLIEKVDDAGGLFPYFSGLIERNRSSVYALAGALVTALIPAIVSMGVSLWTAFAPLLPFIAVGAALGLVVKDLADHFGGFGNLVSIVRDEFVKLYNFLAPIFGPAIKDLVDTWNNQFLPALRVFWAEYGPQILELLKLVGIAIGVFLVANIYIAIETLGFLINVIAKYLSFLANLKKDTEDTITAVVNRAYDFGYAVGFFYENTKNKIMNFIQAVRDFAVAMINGIRTTLSSVAQTFINGVDSGLQAVWGYYGRFVDAGYGLIRAFANGVRGAVGEAVGAAQDVLGKVRNLLPFSDAKEGPLSDLTLSGRRFSETFATGIRQAAGNVQSAVQDTLSTPMAAMSGSLTVGTMAMPTAAQMASQTAGSNSTSTRYGDTVVNIDTINDRQDADYLLHRISRNTQLENMGLSPQLQAGNSGA